MAARSPTSTARCSPPTPTWRATSAAFARTAPSVGAIAAAVAGGRSNSRVRTRRVAAASLADGAFYNNGQSCCAVERIYVHRKIADAFRAKFVEAVKGFVMGDPSDEGTYLGPLTREAQIGVIEAQVKDALERAADNAAGNGAADSWFDGGDAADIVVPDDTWHHFAFTISGTECVVYIDGEVVSQNAFDGIDWTECDMISIMSGAPHFTGWDHWSDLSYMDELRLFTKALTQEEISQIIADEN